MVTLAELGTPALLLQLKEILLDDCELRLQLLLLDVELVGVLVVRLVQLLDCCDQVGDLLLAEVLRQGLVLVDFGLGVGQFGFELNHL